jgi:hypothetical protein
MPKVKKAQAVSLFSEADNLALKVVKNPNSKAISKSGKKSATLDTSTNSAKPPKPGKRLQGDFTSTKDLLSKYQMGEQNKHISHEFQSYGCHMAEALADKQHTSLYIKLAKTVSRGLLERAMSFVSDSTADNKAKLFMWKLEQLKQLKKDAGL